MCNDVDITTINWNHPGETEPKFYVNGNNLTGVTFKDSCLPTPEPTSVPSINPTTNTPTNNPTTNTPTTSTPTGLIYLSKNSA